MKRTVSLVFATAALAGSAIVLSAPIAHADDYVCRGTITNRSIDGDVVVPSGATCTINGGDIDGNVKVYRNATVHVNGTTVKGNLQAENHRHVASARARIDGSIQLKQGGSADLTANRVNSDIQSFTNRGRQVFRSNVVDGNLQCKENVPAPTGGANIVHGNKEDQCRRL
ncbi:hypothetical protein [Granulicoccus sp. GXG6511]|uniref:hypothetical protein n=1 Tax=Granulicoccus sp. GXG6511 TaxID=3381351 RepID=UPI003D7D0312